MSTYSTKNYTAQGGNLTVIGGELQVLGKLTIAPGAEVVGLADKAYTGLATPVIAEEITIEGLAPAQPQPDSVATSVTQLRADYNALLANLREAGVIARDDE